MFLPVLSQEVDRTSRGAAVSAMVTVWLSWGRPSHMQDPKPPGVAESSWHIDLVIPPFTAATLTNAPWRKVRQGFRFLLAVLPQNASPLEVGNITLISHLCIFSSGQDRTSASSKEWDLAKNQDLAKTKGWGAQECSWRKTRRGILKSLEEALLCGVLPPAFYQAVLYVT